MLRCAAPCTLRAPLTVSAAAKRRLGLRTTRVGTASGRSSAAGLVGLRVRIDAAAHALLLRIGRPLTLLARVPHSADDSATTTVVVRFRLLPRATERTPRR